MLVKPDPSNEPSPGTLNVMVVDDEPETERALSHALSGADVVIHAARTLREARSIASSGRIDAAVVGVRLSDGNGLELAGELRREYPSMHSIVVTGRRTNRGVMEAIRAGASDFLVKPINPVELGRCLDRVLHACGDPGQSTRSPETKPRGVRHHAQLTPPKPTDGPTPDPRTPFTQRFIAAVEDELNLELVLRRYLEIIIHEAGATNVAVFLPAFQGGFVVGGYVNQNMERDTVEVLLDGLSSSIEPVLRRAAESNGTARNAALRGWIAESAPWLDGMNVHLMPCSSSNGELDAGVLLFRANETPFRAKSLDALRSVAPLLASHLKKVFRIHHRLRRDEPTDPGFGGSGEACC